MRLLFVSLPAIGHLFPLVPLAWAARSAGHEVLVASCGEAGILAQAGLHLADIAPGVTLKSLFTDFSRQHREINERILAGDDAEELHGVHFGTFAEWLADGAVAQAKAWRPDLVVYERMAPFGLLAAVVLGVPAVRHDLGLDPGHPAGQLRHMASALQRHGVPDLVEDSPWLDIAPPSMAGVGRDGWLLRPVPYNGGGVLPDWVMHQPERSRVAVTLGTIVPRMGGVGVVERIVALAPEVDAEFVLAMQPRDSDKLGRLPANVRAAGWMPMNALLRTCTAVVHHGGSGTMYAALDAGVPQLLLPSGAEDRHINAAAVLDRGAGLACAPEQIDTTVLQRLITDDSVRATTAEVRAELAEMPPPSALVERLEALTH